LGAAAALIVQDEGSARRVGKLLVEEDIAYRV
jgi:hypothetical protein